MKLNKWSVVPTADKKGLALKPMESAPHMEVCVSVREGKLEINIYQDVFILPLSQFQMAIPKKGR